MLRVFPETIYYSKIRMGENYVFPCKGENGYHERECGQEKLASLSKVFSQVESWDILEPLCKLIT